MSFSADAHRAAYEPWTFTTNGKTYAARPVSALQVMRFFSRAKDEEQFITELYILLRHAFPYRMSMRWRGDPVREILKLDRDGLKAAVRDFFSSQGVKMPDQISSPT